MKQLRMTDINEFEALFTIAKELPENERVLFKATTGDEFEPTEFLVAISEVPGQHHIIWDGERPVAAGGFIPQGPGRVRTWFMAPEWAWTEYGTELTELCREQIRTQLAEKLAHRVETVTLADRQEARAWYERIGLTYESTLCGYGASGEDAVMYVAVRKAEVH